MQPQPSARSPQLAASSPGPPDQLQPRLDCGAVALTATTSTNNSNDASHWCGRGSTSTPTLLLLTVTINSH
eukprot:gene3292-5981_t